MKQWLIFMGFGVLGFADEVKLRVGEQQGEGSAARLPLIAKAMPSTAELVWSVDPENAGTIDPVNNENGVWRAIYTPPADTVPGSIVASGELRVCGKIDGSNPEVKACEIIYLPLQGQRGGPFERAIVGYEDAGASGPTQGPVLFRPSVDTALVRPQCGP